MINTRLQISLTGGYDMAWFHVYMKEQDMDHIIDGQRKKDEEKRVDKNWAATENTKSEDFW